MQHTSSLVPNWLNKSVVFHPEHNCYKVPLTVIVLEHWNGVIFVDLNISNRILSVQIYTLNIKVVYRHRELWIFILTFKEKVAINSSALWHLMKINLAGVSTSHDLPRYAFAQFIRRDCMSPSTFCVIRAFQSSTRSGKSISVMSTEDVP